MKVYNTQHNTQHLSRTHFGDSSEFTRVYFSLVVLVQFFQVYLSENFKYA